MLELIWAQLQVVGLVPMPPLPPPPQLEEMTPTPPIPMMAPMLEFELLLPLLQKHEPTLDEPIPPTGVQTNELLLVEPNPLLRLLPTLVVPVLKQEDEKLETDASSIASVSLAAVVVVVLAKSIVGVSTKSVVGVST
jgi:hypothetical protein